MFFKPRRRRAGGGGNRSFCPNAHYIERLREARLKF
jgi:hypothetical protein